MSAPITFDDVRAARERLSPYLTPTPLRNYPVLDAAVPGATLLVKHENMQPTGSFKVRNGLATNCPPEELNFKNRLVRNFPSGPRQSVPPSSFKRSKRRPGRTLSVALLNPPAKASGPLIPGCKTCARLS